MPVSLAMDATWTLWLAGGGLLWVLVVGWTFLLLPRWSRPGLAFAVSVAPDFSRTPAARAILARYRRGTAAVTAAAFVAGLALLAGGEQTAAWMHLILLPQVGAFTWVYLRARRATLPHAVPSGRPEARPRPAGVRLPGGLTGQAGPFALLGAAAAWIASRRSELPASIPVHWGADLEADAWAPPTWPTLLGPPLVGAALCAGMLLMSWAMARRSRSPVDAAQAERLTLMLRVLLGVNYFVALVFVLVGVSMLYGGERLDPLTLVLLVVVPELLGLGLLVWILVRFSRLQAAPPAERVLGDLTDDRFWKAGLVYYNPGDPTIFIEKRFGIGYTLNFARPASWWLLGAVVGLPLAVALLIALLD